MKRDGIAGMWLQQSSRDGLSALPVQAASGKELEGISE